MPASVSILTSDHPLTTTLYSFDLQPVYFSKFSRSLTVLHKIVSSHYKSVRGGISWIRWIKVVDASLKPMSGVFGGGMAAGIDSDQGHVSIAENFTV